MAFLHGLLRFAEERDEPIRGNETLELARDINTFEVIVLAVGHKGHLRLFCWHFPLLNCLSPV